MNIWKYIDNFKKKSLLSKRIFSEGKFFFIKAFINFLIWKATVLWLNEIGLASLTADKLLKLLLMTSNW